MFIKVCKSFNSLLSKYYIFLFCETYLDLFCRMAPMTNAERQRKWREKKAKEVGPEELRKKDKERQQLKRSRTDEDSKKILKEKQAERQRKCRVNKKKTAQSFVPNLSFGSSVFGSFSSKSRSLNRAQNDLPKNPIQKREIVKSLFEYEIDATPTQKRVISEWISGMNCDSRGRPAKMKDEICEKLRKFLDHTDVSYTLPGRQNQIYMGKVDGEKVYKAKKYLLYTYHQLHGLLESYNRDLANLQFSTLYRFIRKNKEYIGCTKIPHVTCLCPICENIELFVSGINSALSTTNNEKLPENCHDLLEKISCKPITKPCSEDSCNKCPFPEETFEYLTDLELVSFFNGKK